LKLTFRCAIANFAAQGGYLSQSSSIPRSGGRGTVEHSKQGGTLRILRFDDALLSESAPVRRIFFVPAAQEKSKHLRNKAMKTNNIFALRQRGDLFSVVIASKNSTRRTNYKKF